jgi:hypothetical protein
MLSVLQGKLDELNIKRTDKKKAADEIETQRSSIMKEMKEIQTIKGVAQKGSGRATVRRATK